MEERQVLVKKDIINSLKKIGINEGDHLIVHTSMSSLGFVVGGEEVIIRALIELVGESGTIMMPAQTWKNLDPSKGVHWLEPEAWWDIIRNHWPAFDKKITPAIGMGAVARMFSTWPGVERSDHPARSFAAYGYQAKHLVENHDLSNIFGKGSPLDKLYKLNGKILLIGVDHNKNTSLHLAETQARFTKKYTTEHSAVLVDGERRRVSYETLDVDDVDFLEVGHDFDQAFGIKDHLLGNAKVKIMNQVDLVNFASEWFTKHRD